MPYGLRKEHWLTWQDAEEYIEIIRESGDGWYTAICPAHDDNKPSLGVTEDDDGYLVVHCLAGCSMAEVIAAIREEMGG